MNYWYVWICTHLILIYRDTQETLLCRDTKDILLSRDKQDKLLLMGAQEANLSMQMTAIVRPHSLNLTAGFEPG